MRNRNNIYGCTQAARYILAVLFVLFPAVALASSAYSKDTVSIAKNLENSIYQVISETDSGIALGTGSTIKSGMQPQTVVPQDYGTCPHEGTEFIYGGNGNITEKSGLGGYSYDATHPHAVAEVENDSCLIGNEDQNIEYNAFGKVSSIEEGGYATAFTYGPDRERWKTLKYRNDTLICTVIYAGDYERVTENGVTRHFYYLDGGAVLVRRDNAPDSIFYI